MFGLFSGIIKVEHLGDLSIVQPISKKSDFFLAPDETIDNGLFRHKNLFLSLSVRMYLFLIEMNSRFYDRKLLTKHFLQLVILCKFLGKACEDIWCFSAYHLHQLKE